MKKYFPIVRNTWDEVIAYRFNFFMWRVRTVLSLLTTYFLWLALIPSNSQLFGYSQSRMLTYILLSFFFNSLIIASRTQEIGENINSGNLSTFLIRPFNYFYYWAFRDIGDKTMNMFFAILEIKVIFFLLHPPIFLQIHIMFLLFTLLSVLIAIILNFLIGCILGMIGFWSPEVWAPRFIFYTLIVFFAGMLFPLDILPKAVFSFLQLLPFTYFLYFPLKIYLGQVTTQQMIFGFTVSVFWVFVFFWLLKTIWKRGLQEYAAYGR